MRQNVNPTIWGPHAWAFLRHCATACDETCSASYKQFLELLPEVLPCQQCREHCGAYIADNPVDTTDLVSWLDRFREAVAKRKASQHSLPRQQRNDGCSSCDKMAKLRVGLLVLGAIVACAALILVVVGLVKLTKASQTK